MNDVTTLLRYLMTKSERSAKAQYVCIRDQLQNGTVIIIML